MSAMASQITSLMIVYSTIYSDRSKKTSKLCVTGLCEGNSPVTGEFPAQRVGNAEIVSIWWRHHGLGISMKNSHWNYHNWKMLKTSGNIGRNKLKLILKLLPIVFLSSQPYQARNRPMKPIKGPFGEKSKFTNWLTNPMTPIKPTICIYLHMLKVFYFQITHDVHIYKLSSTYEQNWNSQSLKYRNPIQYDEAARYLKWPRSANFCAFHGTLKFPE